MPIMPLVRSDPSSLGSTAGTFTRGAAAVRVPTAPGSEWKKMDVLLLLLLGFLNPDTAST